MQKFIAPLLYKTKIAYADTDAGGVVYHARYLDMAERARLDALHQLHYPVSKMLHDHHGCFIVKNLQLDYRAPAYLEDDITILTQPIKLGSASLTFRQEFLCKEKSLAVLEILLVFISYKQQNAVSGTHNALSDSKPKKMPRELSNIFILPSQ